jgi:hypothetical protein
MCFPGLLLQLLHLLVLRVDLDLVGLQHLQQVVVVGLQLRVLQGEVVRLSRFVLQLRLKTHRLAEKFVLAALTGCYLGFECLSFELETFCCALVGEGVGFCLLPCDFEVVLQSDYFSLKVCSFSLLFFQQGSFVVELIA